MKLTLLHSCLVVLALTLGAGSAKASSFSLTNNDASGSSSFNAKGNWGNTTAAPSAGNTYSTAGWMMRTPANSTSYTFAGDALTLAAPTLAGAGNGSLLEKASAARTLTINNLTLAGGLIRSGGGHTFSVTIAGNGLTVSASSEVRADQNGWIISSPLLGGDAIVLTNNAATASHAADTISYSGNNSGFTGTLLLTAGTTKLLAANSVPGNPSVANPGQITLNAGVTLEDDAGVVYNAGNGGITFAGAATFLSTNGPTIIAAPITLNAVGTFNASGVNGTVLSGALSGANTFIKRGSGILTLSGDNSGFSGGVNLYGISAGGQLNINSPTALGTGMFIINNGNNGLIDNTTGSALALVNNNPQTWQNNFAFVGSSSLDMGAGSVSISGNVSVTVSNSTLSVGQVGDGGAGYGLNKLGAGKLVLNGGGSYLGATTVSGGTLAITGPGAFLNSASITVAANATLDVSGAGGLTLPYNSTLAGSGTIVGSVSDANPSNILPGGSGVAGTLTVQGDLTFNGGCSLAFDLSTNSTPGGGTNDLVVVTGTLNLAGPTTIAVTGVPAAGTYTLVQYGSLAGSMANLSAPLGYSLNNNTAAHTIELIVTHVPTALTWLGDGVNNTWDVATTANWQQGGSATVFYTGDSVTFDDTGSISPPVNLAGVISPAVTTVSSTNTFDFTGSPIVSGSLIKSGSGTLILENMNSYSGPTVINAGTLQVGNGNTGALGSGPITNNGTLAFNLSANNATITTAINGSGALVDNGGATVSVAGSFNGSTVTMAGSGSMVLSGSNSYTGATTISGGSLQIANASALGTTNVGTTVTTGGQVYIIANVNIPAEALTLSGAGDGSGALRKGGGGASTLGGPVTLAGDTTLKLDGSATLNLTNSGGINGASANANLTLAGDGGSAGTFSYPLSLGTGGVTVSGGAWTVAATNSYSGATTLNGGTLRIPGLPALGTTPGLSMGGGVLEAMTNITISPTGLPITLNADSVLAVDANATFTVANAIAGSGALTKWLAGTLVLSGPNSFTGNLYLDGGSTSANDGVTRITAATALGGVPVIPGTATILERNNNSGWSTLQLDGSAGPITLAQEFSLACRNTANPNIENVAGTNTLSGNMDLNVGGSAVYYKSDAGLLVFSGTNQYVGVSANGRTITFTGAGNHLVSGPIVNGAGGAPVSVTMSGTGKLTLAADNTYSNVTTVSSGTLAVLGSINSTGGVVVVGGTLSGTGIINDNLSVQSAGTLAPGAPLGLLTVNGNVSLSGAMAVAVNNSASPANSQMVVSGTVVNTGSGNYLTVSNLGPALNTGDKFTLFNQPVSGGAAMVVRGAGAIWNNNLAVDGSISVASPTLPQPVINAVSLTGGNLLFSGTNGYAGGSFSVLSSTNVATPANQWVLESSGTCDASGHFSVTNTVTPGVPQKFYRLQLQ